MRSTLEDLTWLNIEAFPFSLKANASRKRFGGFLALVFLKRLSVKSTDLLLGGLGGGDLKRLFLILIFVALPGTTVTLGGSGDGLGSSSSQNSSGSNVDTRTGEQTLSKLKCGSASEAWAGTCLLVEGWGSLTEGISSSRREVNPGRELAEDCGTLRAGKLTGAGCWNHPEAGGTGPWRANGGGCCGGGCGGSCGCGC